MKRIHKQTSREDQSRNGVRVIVYRSDEGSVVDASCECFGSTMRAHSNVLCPVYLKAIEDAKKAEGE